MNRPAIVHNQKALICASMIGARKGVWNGNLDFDAGGNRGDDVRCNIVDKARQPGRGMEARCNHLRWRFAYGADQHGSKKLGATPLLRGC